jgi:Tfp pilus assembly protein PilV
MNNRGQTLIEVVTSLGLILIVVAALIGLGIVALKTSSSSRNRTVAAKLANEEMELVRSFRDSTDSGKGFSNLTCAGDCYIDSSLNIVAGRDSSVTVAGVTFTRYFNLETISSSKLKVTAKTEWPESGGTKSVSVSSYLTNWR